MSKKIYVGNLPFSATEQEVRNVFEGLGTIQKLEMINDRETGDFRGFCFVEMDEEEAMNAIDKLDGIEVGRRKLRVNEARPRERRSYGGSGGGGYSGD